MNNITFKFKKATGKDIQKIYNLFKDDLKNKCDFFSENKNYKDYTLEYTRDNLFINNTYIVTCNDNIIGYVSFYILRNEYDILYEKENTIFKLLYINELCVFQDFSKLDNQQNINNCIYSSVYTIPDSIYIFLITEILKLYIDKNIIIINRYKLHSNNYEKFGLKKNDNLLEKLIMINKDGKVFVNKINSNLIDILNHINFPNNNKKKAYFKLYSNNYFYKIINPKEEYLLEKKKLELEFKHENIKVFSMNNTKKKIDKSIIDNFNKKIKENNNKYINEYQNYLFEILENYKLNESDPIINEFKKTEEEEKIKLVNDIIKQKIKTKEFDMKIDENTLKDIRNSKDYKVFLEKFKEDAEKKIKEEEEKKK